MRSVSVLTYHMLRLCYYLQVRAAGGLKEAYGSLQNSSAELARYWDKRSQQYERQYGSAHIMPVLEAILRNEASKIKRVMELGCGTGNNIKPLAERFPGVAFLGLDFSPLMVERARAKAAAFDNVEIRQVNLSEMREFELPLQDLVFSRATLQHVHPEALKSLAAHLFAAVTYRIYLEETHVRGLADGVPLLWPFFPPHSFYNHDYIKILSAYGVIRHKKYKLNNMLSCYAVKVPPPGSERKGAGGAD